MDRDKERVKESDSLSCSYTFLHMFIHTCIHNINPEKMKGASAAEKSRVYTRALDGRECNGFKQHIHARVHLAFHSIWHCDTHTHTQAVPFFWTPLTLFKVPWSLGDPACLWSRSKTSFDIAKQQLQHPLLPGRMKKQALKGQDCLLSHCSECCCCFKESLYRNALFMIVIIIIVMII